MAKTSPLAPPSFPDLPAIAGVRLATAAAGIRYQNRTDVLLALFDKGTTVGGVFTKSRCPSAPVDWCKAALAAGRARALLVNAGNANAFTGKRGREATRKSAALAAAAAGCRPREVFLASTGVIGEPLDASLFEGVVADAAGRATASPAAWADAARAIMTTDTYPKAATRSTDFGGFAVTINGIAKGSGMIAPDMATLLAFVVTDAPIAGPVLTQLLKRTTVDTLNAITVDGDTSTSDTLLMFSTGKARAVPIVDASDRRLPAFRDALEDLLRDLAQQVVRDGEGASKFVEVRVSGAASKKSARRIGMAIANSPLVKTAVAGGDANWGRIVMAVGKAGEPAERDRLSISFGDIRVAHRGERDPDYSEEAASAYMKQAEIVIAVDVGVGEATDRVWTCDLTHGYIDINAHYRS
jgi:glutamate N-acetyltransferase/amino-acid N-acetyltransferase